MAPVRQKVCRPCLKPSQTNPACWFQGLKGDLHWISIERVWHRFSLTLFLFLSLSLPPSLSLSLFHTHTPATPRSSTWRSARPSHKSSGWISARSRRADDGSVHADAGKQGGLHAAPVPSSRVRRESCSPSVANERRAITGGHEEGSCWGGLSERVRTLREVYGNQIRPESSSALANGKAQWLEPRIQKRRIEYARKKTTPHSHMLVRFVNLVANPHGREDGRYYVCTHSRPAHKQHGSRVHSPRAAAVVRSKKVRTQVWRTSDWRNKNLWFTNKSAGWWLRPHTSRTLTMSAAMLIGLCLFNAHSG